MRKITSLLMLFCAFVSTAWAQLVQTSTAESPIYYVIASYNRGGVITYDEVGGAIQHKAATNNGKCEWYFEAVPGNTDGGVYVVNKCKDGENKLYLDKDKNVSTTPAVWYVLANGVNKEGVSISSEASISGYSCLDASKDNSSIGGWSPDADDWHGTTWVLFADMENAKYNPNKFINQQGVGGRSINSITINGVKKTTSTYGLAYADHTSRVEFKVVTGSDVVISIEKSGKWMQAFAYVDVDSDGFDTEGVNIDGYTPTGDLVSYSCYDADDNEVGVNSAGTELSGDDRNTVVLPNFTAPATAGKYRLRVKYDWNDLNPNTGEQFITAGSQFVDVILNVVDNPLAPVIPLAETLYASVKDNAGNTIGEYPTDKVNALAAAIEAAKAIADDAATAEDVATLQAAMDAVKVILPTVGQYYQIHSSLTAFSETKAAYSNGTQPEWKTLNNDDQSFYWQAVATADGGVAFKNAKDGKYLQGHGHNQAWTLADESTNAGISVKIFAKGENEKGYEYGLIIGGYQMHAMNHGNGKGAGSYFVGYNTDNANSASSWFIVPVELKIFHDVTYNFVYNGDVKYTQTTSLAEGAAYPEVVVANLPFGVSVNGTTPDGFVTESKTFNFDLTVNLPFVPAATYADITKWYYLKFDSSNQYYLHYDADQDYIDLSSKSVDTDNKDIYSWAFVGDPFDGYQIVNKGAGADYILSSSTTMAGKEGSDTWPIMTKLAELPKGNNTYWIPTASTYATNGFFLAQKDYASNRLNNRDSKLAYWTGGVGNGSTFVAEEALSDDVEIQNLLNEYQTWKALRPVGSGLGQYSYNAETFAAAEQTLNNANTLSDVEDAIEACKNLFQINIPTAGFYRVKSMNANDANKKGKYWQSKVDASGMELAAEKDDARSIIYLGEDNSVTSYGCGYALNQYAGMDAAGTAGKAWRITENAAVPATYALYRNGDGYCLSDWYGLTYGQNDANAAWAIEEVTQLPVKVSAAGYATFYAPVALTLPAELTAYTVSVNGEWATLDEIEGDVIPANTGVVLQGAPETYNLTVAESAETISGNDLLGTVAASYVTADAYVLGYVGEEGKKEVGFYTATKNFNDANEKVEEGGVKWLNNGFKAYLPKPAGAQGALRFNFGGNTTAIESVLNNGVDANAPIYDLSGRRVMNAVKGGIYIQNGKKFIVK